MLFLEGRPGQEERFGKLLRYVVTSLGSDNPRTSYIGVFLVKEHSVAWVRHIKRLVGRASILLGGLTTDHPDYHKQSAFLVLVLISFTATNTWRILKNKALANLAPHMNQICHSVAGSIIEKGLMKHLNTLLLNGLAGSKLKMKRTTLSAVMSLALRPVEYSSYSASLVSTYLLNILSVPGILQQVSSLCPDSLTSLHQATGEEKESSTKTLWGAAVHLLSQDQQLKIHFNALEGSYALCLTANLVHLMSLIQTDLGPDLVSVVSVLTSLLSSCSQYVTAKQSNLSHWHPVLGWFSVSLDRHLQSAMSLVKVQLTKLWSADCVRLMTAHLAREAAHLPPVPVPPASSSGVLDLGGEGGANFGKKLMRQAIEKTKTTYAVTTQTIQGTISSAASGGSVNKLGSPACTKIALVCSLYQTAVRTLSQLRIDILNGLCFNDVLLRPLWLFLNSLGPNCGLKGFLELLNNNKSGTAPEFQMLILFCDTFGHLVTMLDDTEFYEDEKPFSRHEYASLGTFLNTFLYRAIWNGTITDPDQPLFTSMSGLLSILRRRDDRRTFCKHGHWLVKELKLSSLLTDLDKKKPAAKLLVRTLPHSLPHQERVLLFRKKVQQEKTNLGIVESDSVSPQSTLISVHRNRIVEDGYRQLGSLAPNNLKGVIRVRFVNLQGLDEAGIDQDGVFKEFLEETIKKVFDPGLNLFCTTSEERLYPSPTSNMTDNHLDLFEFVGKMIGKAVYEGIVVDVPFASFFLTQVLGHDHSALYSYLDEMPSSDPELHKNLTYVKHYDGEVEDLGLTFSFDQDILGQIVTHELIPGGRSINVTASNRISYIHHMAHFKMHRQIQSQVAAFRRGFRCLIPPDWLSLFSGPEVQRLISGDNSPIDLKDLRRNTSYYGGFHDSHRVVVWLWDLLEKDFSDKEKSAFLKFVTSCSKPPLLGFDYLEPPFSIRCVEVADDDDDGDTVGSVLRGFLALRKRDPVNRLPTASTCFNLLKLPNYQKKSTLREKLRYAITCNTGFELS